MPPSKPHKPSRPLSPEEEAILGAPEDVDPIADLGTSQDVVVPVGAYLAPPPPAPRWRVKKTVHASYFGQLITLVEGDVIIDSSYDMKRLLDAGVELEKVV